MSEETPECPECGDDMVRRRNRRTGNDFFGCVMYPQCDGTVPIDEAPVHPGYPEWARGKNE